MIKVRKKSKIFLGNQTKPVERKINKMSVGEENTLEIAYKAVCNFEKKLYEEFSNDEDNQITYKLNKDKYSELESSNTLNEQIFQAMHFSSYQDLYHSLYKDTFERNMQVINLNHLQEEIGKNNLFELVRNDNILKNIYLEKIKELDLDNDGVSDRTDIDDADNSVQTVADLHIVGNSTNKETAKNKKHEELELEL